MKLAALSQKQIMAAEKTLNAGMWAITAGAVLFSVLTVTPLVAKVTPDGWDWTAPILPLVVDAAVVIVIRLDATVSRLGGNGGAWPVILRWLTGMFTLALNIGDSALKGDRVGVAVHAVAPALLIVTAEAGLAYRRAIAKALDRIEREQEAEAERRRVHERREREAREQEQREREQRERAERERQQERQERREREAREHAALLEQQRRDHEAKMAREQRETEIALRREEAERQERERERERQEQAAREQQERAERERRERERREREERERQEREQQEQEIRERAERAARERRERQAVNAAVNTRRPSSVNAPVRALVNDARLSEAEARSLIVNTPGASVRDLADKTGWSIGWVSKVRNERSEEQGHEIEIDLAGGAA
ncbi:hypothetical protein [Planomonospora sp. ID82291]|uniref:hypothetical protein n=1 Tax=Planomonospora sp. ID82291 TaxID=2738136 RepID=UPI0018C4063A|nr:hypothetical protein [Planomonospora sp. ID82291]MBG0819092.1 DUF2637 domain-containing protein [Planomonospora sp. ID82291]